MLLLQNFYLTFLSRSFQIEPASLGSDLVFSGMGFFQRNPPLRVGGIIFDDEIHCVDEICLDGRIVDFICITDFILA